jgi:hypothetical protein
VTDAPKILWYDDQDCSAGPVQFGDDEIKYVRADLVDVTEPARKPMTDEEIEKGMDVNALSHFEACAFASGVRFAEKHHEIGRGME